MLHGVTVRSPLPRGVIRDIRYGPGIPWDAITIVTARDIPGANVVALITDDQPYLAAGRVNHPEEPVLLLAHADPVLLQEARRSVTIEIDSLPPVFTMDEALSGREIHLGRRQPLQVLPRVARRRGRGAGCGRHHRRGGIRHRRAGAALHRAERDAGRGPRGRRRRRRHGVGFYAVSVLCSQGVVAPSAFPGEGRSGLFRWRPVAASAARKNIRQ